MEPSSGRERQSRPPVSLVVPFFGDEHAASSMLEALAPLVLVAADEIVLGDNTPNGVLSRVDTRPGMAVVAAAREQTAYHARNCAAEHASNEWLLFIDSDCEPVPDLLDAYFSQPVADDCGAVAGEVVGASDQTSLAARYARSRRLLCQADSLRHPFKPAAVTANLLVRRAAWQAVGGFNEGVRSGEDFDFCWRLQDAGWQLAYCERASVAHRHREGIPALLRQAARDAAGRAWLVRRHPGSFPAQRPVRDVARGLASAVRWLVAGKRERAAFRALDALVVLAVRTGTLLPNVPPGVRRRRDPRRGAGERVEVVLVDVFPEVSDASVAQARTLERAATPVRVEASGRARRQELAVARDVDASFREDDSALQRLAASMWLVSRHPLRTVRDLAARPRWRRHEIVTPLRALAPVAWRLARGRERRVHAHSASSTALDAVRLSRFVGLSYRVTDAGDRQRETPRP